MFAFAGVLAAALACQVPPPDTTKDEADSLRGERRAVLSREASRLTALAETLAARGERGASDEVRRALPAPDPDDGSTRFVPLPEVVPARRPGLANVAAGSPPVAAWKAERDAIRSGAAEALFDLAARAAGPTRPHRHYALADACLRGVVDRLPDHPEARRLLGFEPFEGGWATPFAAGQVRHGMTLHSTYGWVKQSWVSHLEKGELPSRAALAQGREVWVPAARADAERSEWRNAWTITTEHFQVRTNVPLSEAIAFGRHLEMLHQLFDALLADVVGEHLPMAQRFKTVTKVGEARDVPHSVSYYATKAEFADALRPQQPDVDQSLGLYLPAPRGKRRGHAYFYRDDGGEIAVTATLSHEVSHQLLFESGIARPDDYKENVGNYWVFEGLGTYFETIAVDPDGSVRVGGMVGPRIAEARKNLVGKGRMVPLAAFVRYNQDAFNGGDIFLHYQQAIALTTFLMQARGGAYREDFLDYVKDACRGRLKVNTGRSLESRVGKPYAEIEAEFLAYLKGGEPPAR